MTKTVTITAEQMAKLCELFGSDKLGERAAAAAKVHNKLKHDGLTWQEMWARALGEKPTPQAKTQAVPQPDAELVGRIKFCQAFPEHFVNDKEAPFLTNMLKSVANGFFPTEKQLKWINQIYARIQVIEGHG